MPRLTRAAISERRYPGMSQRDALRSLITNHLAPHYDLVLAEMSKTGETEIPLEGVYKKLYDPESYTGVYKERFRSGDGRINGETDNRPGRAYAGSTNTGTDDTIHDISVLMRPNLHGAGTMMSPANHVLAKKGSARHLSSAGSSRALLKSPTAGTATPSRSGTATPSGARSASVSAGFSLGAAPAARAPAAFAGMDAETLLALVAKAQAGDPSALVAWAASAVGTSGSGGGGSSAGSSPTTSHPPAPPPRPLSAPAPPPASAAVAVGLPTPAAGTTYRTVGGPRRAGDEAAAAAEVDELEGEIAMLKESLAGEPTAAPEGAAGACILNPPPLPNSVHRVQPLAPRRSAARCSKPSRSAVPASQRW